MLSEAVVTEGRSARNGQARSEIEKLQNEMEDNGRKIDSRNFVDKKVEPAMHGAAQA